MTEAKTIRTISVQVPVELVSFLIDKLANTPCEQAGWREARILEAIGDAKREAGISQY